MEGYKYRAELPNGEVLEGESFRNIFRAVKFAIEQAEYNAYHRWNGAKIRETKTGREACAIFACINDKNFPQLTLAVFCYHKGKIHELRNIAFAE